jgi:Na+/glutamate symporter
MTVIRQVDPHPMKLFLNRNVYLKELSLISGAWNTFYLVLQWLKGGKILTTYLSQSAGTFNEHLSEDNWGRENTKKGRRNWDSTLDIPWLMWISIQEYMSMATSVIVDNCINILSYIFYPLSFVNHICHSNMLYFLSTSLTSVKPRDLFCV